MATTTLKRLAPYRDDRGNEIVYSGDPIDGVNIIFRGDNNRLVVDTPTRVKRLSVAFDCDDGFVGIGASRFTANFQATIQVGERCQVVFGEDITMTGICQVTTAEATNVIIGNDVMIARDVIIRTHDSHPIFDVTSGLRVNPAESVHIGNHVWLADRSAIFGGATIGDGSVVGFGSLVTGRIDNNQVAAGVPARGVRSNVGWARNHLNLTVPRIKPDASSISNQRYWALTKSTSA